MTDVAGAFLLGLLSASSLGLGALTSRFWRPTNFVLGLLTAFGAGSEAREDGKPSGYYACMDALVEVHDEPELDRALAVDARIVGVNQRRRQSASSLSQG